ncbi:MAG: hypothetical protein IT303_09560 [Dehalococcoidia bacterium]|nr:hypothetical protein [Dehalococcoidia bacterium]
MDGTIISVLPDALRTFPMHDGRRAQVRPLSPAERSAVTAFASSPEAHFLSRPSHCVCHRTSATPAEAGPLALLGAFTPDDLLVGAAWLEHVTGGEAQLALAVNAGMRHGGLVPGLLRAIAEEARARNVHRLTACVPRDSHDPLADFRAAGVRVSSSICLGGVSDVVLDLE